MDVVKFNVGAIVYRKVLPEVAGIVTGIIYRSGSVEYFVTFSDQPEIIYQDIELTIEKSFSVEDINSDTR